MSQLVDFIALEMYNSLLENYDDLLESLRLNPIIRRPNKFYELFDIMVIQKLSNAKLKYYVLRDIRPTWSRTF